MIERVLSAVRAKPRAFDASVAIVWTALSFATDHELWEDTTNATIYVAGSLVIGPALYWRRTYPVHVFALHAFVVLVLTIVGLEDPVPAAMICGTYSLAAHTTDRRQSVQAFFGFVALGLVIVLFEDASSLPDVLVTALFLGIAWVIGDSLRTRRAYQASILERAERAEALRDSLAHQAVAEERARIARDLHDVVAHSMSLMVVQAGAARRVATSDPAASVRALEAIESVGRNSLEEMRRILGVLRGDETGANTAPQPDIEALNGLVEEFRTAGLPVSLTLTGRPRELAPTLELTAFRIVQESLTNTLKHAGPARATVELDFGEHDLHITVQDDGRPQGSIAVDDFGSHKGHVGMRERVASFGGLFSAKPLLGGGYRVAVTLPLPLGEPADASVNAEPERVTP